MFNGTRETPPIHLIQMTQKCLRIVQMRQSFTHFLVQVHRFIMINSPVNLLLDYQLMSHVTEQQCPRLFAWIPKSLLMKRILIRKEWEFVQAMMCQVNRNGKPRNEMKMYRKWTVCFFDVQHFTMLLLLLSKITGTFKPYTNLHFLRSMFSFHFVSFIFFWVLLFWVQAHVHVAWQ